MIIDDTCLLSVGDGVASLEYMPFDEAIPTDVFMTCSSCITSRVLPNLEKVAIPSDGFKPVIWREAPKRGHGSWVGYKVPDIIRSFERRCEKAIADIDSQPRGFVCVVRGDEKMSASALGGTSVLFLVGSVSLSYQNQD